MDKNKIKEYAIWARRELIGRVLQKAQQYGIEKGKIIDENQDSINGVLLSNVQKKQRQALIKKIREEGYDNVIEEVAYIWFNRFIALRFMEVNGYLPSYVRVFSNENGEFKPQILQEAIRLEIDGLDKDEVIRLKNNVDDDGLFKYIVITQCNALNKILPNMFQKIEDYTQLLFPDYLLREGSVLERLVNDIPEDNFDVNTDNGQIEIIGWMYQYYIDEKHKEVIDPLHGRIIKKEEIPAATQLFTTDWVVRYIVDNSVGRYWIERNPNSKLADELTYFVKPKDGHIKIIDEKITPQEITVFDPCVGSGHFLLYAFEVLMKIYVEYGYSERDAASEIIKNNLYGLDIDGRAAQLAYFAVMMKARYYDRRFFSRGIKPKVYEICESNTLDEMSIEHFCQNDDGIRKDVDAIIKTFVDAKEYGSTLYVPAIDFSKIDERFNQLSNEISIYNECIFGDLKKIIDVAWVMSKKYVAVVTNPPYLNKYDENLRKYVFERFNKYKSDLFSVFMYRNFDFCVDGGYLGFMTPLVWMFIKTYEDLRLFILNKKSITTLIQFEYHAFGEADVQICSFVVCNKETKKDDRGIYFDLSEFNGGMEVQRQKVLEAIGNRECGYIYESSSINYTRLPNSPIAYSVSDRFFEIFNESKNISDYGDAKQGMFTGCNDLFVRYWFEISFNKFSSTCRDRMDLMQSNKKWFPYNKGGKFRKWYGNDYYVVNWENDGFEIRNFRDEKTGKLRSGSYNLDYIYRQGITWTSISSGDFVCRYSEYGRLADAGGSMLYMKEDKNIFYFVGLMNSVVSIYIMKITSPTINFKVGRVAELPVIMDNVPYVESLVKRAIDITKTDWDSFQISWNFTKSPLIRGELGGNKLISDMYDIWEKECDQRFNELKEIEEEINRQFIKIYNWEDELSPNVDDKYITARKADQKRDIIDFISYAVGVMFGRYSLDCDGLIYAGGEWDNTKYKTFIPSKDAIIPICDDEYFEDDVCGLFVKFVQVVYGKDTLEQNLGFIANALGGRGTSREIIRNYFVNDFYEAHLKDYNKLPIYWLFDSGKKNGFKCLVYLHRYRKDTIARIRTDYIHKQQAIYRVMIEDIEHRLLQEDGSNKIKLSKKLNVLKSKDEELHTYEEKVHHIADRMIDIDLDDGIKNNYVIFGDILKKIK